MVFTQGFWRILNVQGKDHSNEGFRAGRIQSSPLSDSIVGSPFSFFIRNREASMNQEQDPVRLKGMQ